MTRPDAFLSLLTGSFSTPAGDNPTVAMVEAAYRDLGLDARYINCEVAPAALGDAVRGARAMGWVGFNCSMPHKLTVIQHLDGLAESARLIGAVNCAVMRDGALMGENTDGQGFIASLRPVADPARQHVVLFGAGGAARAIAVELALAGAARLSIVNRDLARAGELAAHLNEHTPVHAQAIAWDGDFRVPESAGIVVNATSIGLGAEDHRLALDIASLQAGMVVADVIPNPPRTALIRDAAARGCIVLDGLGMLVNQGLIGIAHWTGRQANPAVMRATLEALL